MNEHPACVAQGGRRGGRGPPRGGGRRAEGATARRMMGKRIASSGISLRGWHIESGVPLGRRGAGQDGAREGEKSRPEGKDYE